MRLLTQTSFNISGNERCVKVYKDAEYGEFVCRLFINGVENATASYHTDDKLDALQTATLMLTPTS